MYSDLHPLSLNDVPAGHNK